VKIEKLEVGTSVARLSLQEKLEEPIMSDTSRKVLPSWREASEAQGFGILCMNRDEGERFTLAPLDQGRLAEFTARGLRVGVSITEFELRAQLTAAGFSDAETDAAIRLSRDWATTFVTQAH
jgi:hypothetical protein